MAKVTMLTLSSLIRLVNIDGLYLIGYAWLFGMCESRANTLWGISSLTKFDSLKLFGFRSLEVSHSLHLVYAFV
jgi:hypothetical protein